MPYIYSNHGLSIRWEDGTYVTQDGETASDVFVPPPEPPSEQSAEQSALLTPVPAPSMETRLATLEVRLEQFLRIASGVTTAITQH